MNIIHRFAFKNNSQVAKEFEALGYKLSKRISTGLDIGENDNNWEIVKKIVKKYSLFDCQYCTIFTNEELDNAEYYVFGAKNVFDYPMPDGYSEYMHGITYNDSDRCSKCGAGYYQIAPFRFKKQPAWTKYDVVQTNWVEDEVFVSKKVRDILLKELDVKFEEALQQKKFIPFDDMFQIKEDGICEIDTSKFVFTKCPECGVEKTKSVTAGFYPKMLHRPPSGHVFKSQVNFGSGAYTTWHELIVDKSFYEVFKINKIRGAVFIPLES